MVKVKQDIEKCIGCGACVTVCPDNWEFGDAKPHPIKTEVEEVGCNKKAAEVCPVKCITVEE